MTTIKVLSEKAIRTISLSTKDIVAAVESGLVAQQKGFATYADTVSFQPSTENTGTLSVVRGASLDDQLSMIKVVGTYPENSQRKIPTNPGMLMLMDLETGEPQVLANASLITTMRTAAVTAIGAARLSPANSRCLGVIGARGIAALAARYICELLPLETIKIHSRNIENTVAAGKKLAQETGKQVIPCSSWESTITDADIIIEGASLPADRPFFPASHWRETSLLIAFGYRSSMPENITSLIDELFLDRWSDDASGAFGPQLASGTLTGDDVSGYIGDGISGDLAVDPHFEGRRVFWHRGVAACDIALTKVLVERARADNLLEEVSI